MSTAVHPPKLSKRILLLVGATLALWLAATLGADGLVEPVQTVVRLFEQLFGLHIVPEPAEGVAP